MAHGMPFSHKMCLMAVQVRLPWDPEMAIGLWHRCGLLILIEYEISLVTGIRHV